MPQKQMVCAIINFWDCAELLPYAVANWRKCGAEVIIVYSDYSNYGEYHDNTSLLKSPEYRDCHIFQCEPAKGLPVQGNETYKRNFGLDMAKKLGFKYFVTADADEFYDPEEFKTALKNFKPECKGLVCASQVYFGQPNLTIGLDVTLVPFIHRLTPTIQHEFNRRYPYAWDKRIRIDPTRQLNINDGVYWSEIIMHHYSYVRKDIRTKIRNSTAKMNIQRSNVVKDFLQAKDGYFCEFYGKPLIHASVDFGIPYFDHGELQDLQFSE